MEIKRSGSQPSARGPARYFTGDVRIDPLFEPPAPARTLGATVTFEPGARTARHTHPLGQILIVTAGCGWRSLTVKELIGWNRSVTSNTYQSSERHSPAISAVKAA
jgi:quercetin dioxygenase-like cupin family protein